jgi:hypothetical protein
MSPVLLMGMHAAPALAQPEKSPADLRAENDRLRERISQLESQVSSLQEDIERKDRLIDQLRDAIRKARSAGGSSEGEAAGTDESAPEEPAREVAPVPDDPFASPASMVRHLQAEYTKQFGDPDLSDQRARQQYLRDLRGWARDAGRGATGPVEWRVKVLELADAQGSAVDATVERIDQQSGLPFGDAFTVKITGRNVARVKEGGVGSILVLDGVLRSEIKVDESVTDEASAAEGAYIGPCAVYTFDVAIRSLRDS